MSGQLIVTGIIGIVALTTVFSSMYIVPEGYRGIEFQFGKIETVSNEGLNFKTPFVSNVIEVDVRTKLANEKGTASTKDLQTVTTQISVNYHLDSNKIADIYKNTGLDVDSKIINPRVQEILKASTASFSAEELISKREDVKAKISTSLTHELNKYHIVVDGISITDFNFSRTFNEAIEAKSTAEQLKLKADRDLERIKVEAEQKIASARAEAESLRLQKDNVSDNMVKLRQIEMNQKAIEKWDGKLPNVNSGALPFINVDAK